MIHVQPIEIIRELIAEVIRERVVMPVVAEIEDDPDLQVLRAKADRISNLGRHRNG